MSRLSLPEVLCDASANSMVGFDVLNKRIAAPAGGSNVGSITKPSQITINSFQSIE